MCCSVYPALFNTTVQSLLLWKRFGLLKLEKIVTIFLYLICYTADGSRVLAIEKLSLERNWKGSCSVMSDSLRPHGWKPTRLLPPWDSPGKSTGVGHHFLLQGIFPTQDRTQVSRIVGRHFYHKSHWGSLTSKRVWAKTSFWFVAYRL